MGDRDRSPRRDRRSGGGASNGQRLRRGPADKRVFLNNLPFEAKWQDVKDLFRKEVGEVSFVELFEDETGRPRGAGIMEFTTKDLAKKALDKMNRFDYKGRKIVVKEDADVDRDRHGRIITDRDRMRGGRDGGGGRDRSAVGNGGGGGPVEYGATYGLSTRFLESLGIDCPLHTRVFVANLTYDVEEKKLKEVFRLAGKVVGCELTRDKEGKSRGFAVIVYEHPVEAVQAISMFHDQQLNDRRMTVRFDKVPEEEPPRNLNRLPDGLRGVGMGLGQDGAPLWDVKNNLPSGANEGNALGLGNMATSMVAQPAALNQAAALQTALATILGMGGGAAAANTGAASMAGMSDLGMGGGMANMDRSSMSRGMDRMMDRGMDGGMDRGMGGGMDHGMDRGMAGGMDRGMGGGMDRGMGGGMDRGMGGGMDRGMGGGMDRGMGGGMDRGMGGGMDRGMGGGMDRGMGGGMDRGMGGGMDRGMGGGMDRGMGGGMDRGMGVGMGGGGMGRGGMDRGGMGGGMGGALKSDRIVVKNLPADITWKILKDRFGHAGDIKFAEMKERGVGVIRFGSERDAERATAMMNGQIVGGERVQVTLL